jgi:predicted neutral ceramidase superfamily lipid hydrolase
MINFQDIFIKSLSNLYETAWPALLLLLCIAAILYIFRYEITDTHKQLRKLENSMFNFIAIPVVATLVYLIINQHFILLFLLFLAIALYVAYKLGLVDKYF